MGRPPLPLGTYGKIRVVPIGTSFRARAKYRDYDGVVRSVERFGASESEAENNLRIAFRDRGKVIAEGEITPESKMSAVEAIWRVELHESEKATRTRATYEDIWDNVLAPAVAALRVADFRRVSTAERIIRAIRTNNGPGRAKHARVVLSQICGIAVRLDALDANPVPKLAPAPRRRKAARASVLTQDSVARLKGHLRAGQDPYDLVDLVDTLSGLGCRIGELLALDVTKADFDSGTLAIEGTVIRVKGLGLVVQPHTKSEAGMRTIRPAQWTMEILRRRVERGSLVIFPSSVGTLRDPDNTRKYLRKTVQGTEWEGLHPHAFRHYVSTQLDRAKWTAREIADYLGHERVSMTLDEYMDRHVSSRDATPALTEVVPVFPDEEVG
ncbi:MAG: tyrosine-type recombinase/integrase [Actinomycetota bacterium]|nr:tyrosine-type recombinase/integrase [Actinomycetota bacterium]